MQFLLPLSLTFTELSPSFPPLRLVYCSRYRVSSHYHGSYSSSNIADPKDAFYDGGIGDSGWTHGISLRESFDTSCDSSTPEVFVPHLHRNLCSRLIPS